MGHDMIEGDENAWHQDPNQLRLENPEPEIKRRKLQGKQTVSDSDSVRTDHGLQRSSGGKHNQAGGDDHGRAQEIDPSKTQALREEAREGMERGHEQRQMDSSSPERNSMEALDHLHRDKGEGREGQETNREDQSQTMDDDNTAQLEEERSLGPWLYRRAELYKIQMDQIDQMEMFS